MQPQEFKVGTSGWRFADWAGAFYPIRIPQSKWLEYYAARFSVGEVNSTYYRIPSVRSFEAMVTKTPDDFEFMVKVHGDVTHHRSDPSSSMRRLLEVVAPLKESGKLVGFLAQFPSSVKYSADAFDYLRGIRDLCEGVPLCVEFRHRSWEESATVETVHREGMIWVSTDEPNIEPLMSREIRVTADTLYLRLHGRNERTWYDRSEGDRYDYNYHEEELVAIGREVVTAGVRAKRGYILFNNCHAGQAPRHAWWLKMWLENLHEGTTEA